MTQSRHSWRNRKFGLVVVVVAGSPIVMTVLWTPSASMRTTVVVVVVVLVAVVVVSWLSGISKRCRNSRLAVAQRSYSSLRLKQGG